MPKPVISTTQSVLHYLQHQQWSFQPYASNDPTGWTSSPLPAGLTLNATTGLITGAAEKAGVYNLALRASNADGTSDPVIFAIGIEASVEDPTANVIDIDLDLGTREVTRLGADAGEPLFTGKYDDDLVFRVQTKCTGVPADITMADFAVVIKEFDGDPVLVTGDEFLALGQGVFLLYLPLRGDVLEGALSAYEEDTATAFNALCELEWVAENSLGVGPETVRGSSLTFPARIVRDLKR